MNKKKKKNIRNQNLSGIWLVLLSIFIAELLLYTWCRVQFVRTGYVISEETQKNRHLMALQKKLRIELAHLKSPERIGKIAETQLGLIMPNAKQTIIIP
jgi:cell division protein FtsL